MNNQSNTDKKLLRHIVFWKFKDFAEGASREENMAKARQLLKALLPIIPEIKYMEIGPDIHSPECDYDMALYMTFESEQDLLTYKNHPEHVKVSKFIGSVRESRAACNYYID